METKYNDQLATLSRTKARNGYSSLHLACTTGSAWMVELLLMTGADVDSKCKMNRTPLYIACDSRYAKFGDQNAILTLLLNHGASLDNLDSNGDTPLHFASIRGSAESIEMLLTRGADLDSRNVKGQRPLEQTNAITPRRSVLLRHVVKLKTAGFRVSDENTKLVENFMECPDRFSYVGSDLLDYHRRCAREIATMHEAKVAKEMTISDFVDIADCHLSKYARNSEVIMELDGMDLEGKFPLYANFIRLSLARCLYRKQQLCCVETLIESNLVNSNLSGDIVRNLVDCMDEDILERLSFPSNDNLVADIVSFMRWRNGEADDDFYLVSHEAPGTNVA